MQSLAGQKSLAGASRSHASRERPSRISRTGLLCSLSERPHRFSSRVSRIGYRSVLLWRQALSQNDACVHLGSLLNWIPLSLRAVPARLALLEKSKHRMTLIEGLPGAPGDPQSFAAVTSGNETLRDVLRSQTVPELLLHRERTGRDAAGRLSGSEAYF
mgnify:CR=1 FL=1